MRERNNLNSTLFNKSSNAAADGYTFEEMQLVQNQQDDPDSPRY